MYMQKIFISTIILLFGVFLLAPMRVHAGVVESGDLIKASDVAVYYYFDGKRYVFPNEDVYFSWYENFDTVKTIPDKVLADIPIGGNVTFRPGTKLIKIVTDPRVYVILQDNKLRWLVNEDVAKALYGDEWAKEVRDVSDALFLNYEMDDAFDVDEFNTIENPLENPLVIAKFDYGTYSKILNNYMVKDNTGNIASFVHPDDIEVTMINRYGYSASSTLDIEDLANFFVSKSKDWQLRLNYINDYTSGTAKIMNYSKTHEDGTFSHRSVIISRELGDDYSELSFQEIKYPKGYLAYPEAATIDYILGDNDLRQTVITNADLDTVLAWYATVGAENGWEDFVKQDNLLDTMYSYYKSYNKVLSRTMEHLYMNPGFTSKLNLENLLVFGVDYSKIIMY